MSGAKPRHHLLIATDITRFSQRDEAAQILLRKVMYQITRQACDTAGLPWHTLSPEDRGDGILLVSSRAGLETFLTTLIQELRAGIQAHNRTAQTADHRLQMRIALTDGYVHRDEYGVTGTAVNSLFRLLDAEPLRKQIQEAQADFGLIVSDSVYQTAAGYHLIDPGSFSQADVDVKGTRLTAWILDPMPGREA